MPGRDVLRGTGGVDGGDSARVRRQGAALRPAARPHHGAPALGGAQGKASDIEITAREILRLKDVLNGILAEAAGKTPDAVVQDTDRDHFMSADEAKAWGIVDNVL